MGFDGRATQSLSELSFSTGKELSFNTGESVHFRTLQTPQKCRILEI